jgi:uncharacterized membrane protein YdbT with pleckstrin-like domain
MKILSNFNTEFRNIVLSQKREEFPNEQILVVLRSRYYFLLEVFIPFVFLAFLLVSMFAFLQYVQAFSFIFPVLSLVWLLVFWFRIFRKYLKYKYDFTIVTPRWVFTYKQNGILESQMKEIPAKRIKAIQISRTGILGNIFGFGEIDIIADMSDNAHMGEEEEAPWVTGLTYVDQPFKVKTQISKLCFE